MNANVKEAFDTLTGFVAKETEGDDFRPADVAAINAALTVLGAVVENTERTACALERIADTFQHMAARG